MDRIASIQLYDEGTTPTLDLGEVSAYLRARTSCAAVIERGPFLLEHSLPADRSQLAARVARLKVIQVNSPPKEHDPAYAEIEFERRRLANEDRGPFGVLYDGFEFQRFLRGLLPPADVRLDRVDIVFTNRTIGTWDEGDLRYHLRSIILGAPAIISTTGLVEAPAKPREFYLAREQLGLASRSELTHAVLKERFKGRFLDHDDPRLMEVLKGYAMQAVVYQFTGEAFCSDPECRLFNAHWQEELLRAQVSGAREYCERHEELLARMRESS